MTRNEGSIMRYRCSTARILLTASVCRPLFYRRSYFAIVRSWTIYFFLNLGFDYIRRFLEAFELKRLESISDPHFLKFGEVLSALL